MSGTMPRTCRFGVMAVGAIVLLAASTSGGTDLLEALANPDHLEHEELIGWVPLDFDPARFDMEQTNAAMRSPRPSRLVSRACQQLVCSS